MAAKCRMKKTSFKQGMMTNNISCKQLAVLRLEGRDAKGATTIEANPAPPQPANCHANSHRPPLRNPAILFWCGTFIVGWGCLMSIVHKPAKDM